MRGFARLLVELFGVGLFIWLLFAWYFRQVPERPEENYSAVINRRVHEIIGERAVDNVTQIAIEKYKRGMISDQQLLDIRDEQLGRERNARAGSSNTPSPRPVPTTWQAPPPGTLIPNPAPVPPAAIAPPGIEPKVFRLVEVNPALGIYMYQLDARVPMQELTVEDGTPLLVQDGDSVEFTARGRVCALSYLPCNGPDGHDGRPMDVSPANRGPFLVFQYPFQQFFFDALVGCIANTVFQIGSYRPPEPVLPGTGQQRILVGHNTRLPEIGGSKEGEILIVRIYRRH